MKRNKLIGLLLAAGMVLTTAGCGTGYGGSSAAAPEEVKAAEPKADAIKIKLANQFGADHPQNLADLKFKELLESKSDGAFVVEVYANNQLGAAEVWNDMLIKGTLEMGHPGGMMTQNYPLTATVECPYILRDWAHVRKAFLETDIFDRMFADMPEKVGVRSLGMMPIGYRVVSSNKKIESLDDFKGLRLRVPNIVQCVWFAEGVGANPISMNMSEMFTALEQGAVDAQENPYSTILANKLYEVQKYIFDSKHMFTAHNWFINEKFWQSLTDDQRALIQECVDEATLYSFELAEQGEADAIQELQDYGLEVTFPSDELRQQLIDSQAATRESFFKEFEGSQPYIEEIMAIQ